jgi:hypothetical protein
MSIDEYEIHNNGDIPFVVKIENNTIYVYKNEEERQLILSRKPLHIFIGESPINKMTEFSGGYGKEFRGNTILLENTQINNTTYEYTYIGNKIFTFLANKIEKYVSPVGNNDVPYPYAIDVNNFTYLMIENVILKKDLNENDWNGYEEPYDCYYNNGLITSDNGRIPRREPKINNFLNIKEFYCGKDTYTLTYEPDPEKKYNNMYENLGKPSYKDVNDNIIDFTKEKYIEFMNKFGDLMGYEKMNVVRIDVNDI